MEKKTAIEIYEERKRIRLQRQKDRPAEQERIMQEYLDGKERRAQEREEKRAENKKAWKEIRKEAGKGESRHSKAELWEMRQKPEVQSEPPAKPTSVKVLSPKQQRRARMKARSLGLAPPLEKTPPPVFKNLRRTTIKPPSTKPKSAYAQRRARMKARIFGANYGFGYGQLEESIAAKVYKNPQQVIIETANPTPPRRKYENEKMRNKARMNTRLKELKDE